MKESGENYLETILVLKQRQGAVRSVDIAQELSYSKPSVSRAMGILRSAGLIETDKNGFITLTEEGKAKAEAIYERHRIIAEFLMRVPGVEKEQAVLDACRIEHVISAGVFEKIRSFVKGSKN
ncbi:MAG: Transcriptional regulator MntR [Firmicutes bacterium ADurb.Bin182]|nr:MAG: Transcriptional regulator MntR [Firmicutes bacterium ADurb.Bin182]